MSIGDKRKHPRIDTNIKMSYVTIDDKGNEKEDGIGEIMNVSQGGILLETTKFIGSPNILLTTSSNDDETLKMKGDVVYCILGPSGAFRIGVKFHDSKEDIKLFVTNLEKITSEQKIQ